MGGEGRGGKGGGEHPGLVVESRRASPQPLLTLVASSAGSVGVAHTLSLLADTLAGAGVLGGASLGGHGASLCGYTGGEETSLAGVVVRADRVNLRPKRSHSPMSQFSPSQRPLHMHLPSGPFIPWPPHTAGAAAGSAAVATATRATSKTKALFILSEIT
jgi:hypothetical protein